MSAGWIGLVIGAIFVVAALAGVAIGLLSRWEYANRQRRRDHERKRRFEDALETVRRFGERRLP